MPFRDVIGHRLLLALLRRSVAGGTLPPSLLLTGPSGIGKRLTAVAVAQALNCLERSPAPSSQPPAEDACGACAACKRIARGVHPDVLIIVPGDSGTIKVDQIRDIVERVAYRPFEGRRRAVIIDDADALVPAAQNALLKTLEEPPSASVFMLVTARPDVLLPTVRSRCPQLRFSPLALSDVAAALMRRGLGEGDARAIAATSDGSLGQALEARAGDLVEARDIAERVLAQASSDHDPGRRLEGAKALLAKSGGGGTSDRERLATRLRVMAVLLRDAALLAVRADDRALANPDIRPALESLAPVYRGERGIRAFASIDRALVALTGNVGVKLVADWLALQL
jgi:DNA polymerase-3 subunit delta'